MKTKTVLLRDDVEKLGRCGDVVRVATGYARNYLLPRGIAVQATPENQSLMERRRMRLEADYAARSAEFEARAGVLSAVRLRTERRADENGHLFGSVNAAAIAELLAGAGQQVEEKDVRLDSPLRTLGTHAVRLHVFGDLYAEITVEIEGDADTPKPAAPEAEAASEPAEPDIGPDEAPADVSS